MSEVQHILGHTQVKTTQSYAHLSHGTLLDATNSVNTAQGGMFVPMMSSNPAGQVGLAVSWKGWLSGWQLAAAAVSSCQQLSVINELSGL